MVPLVRLTLLLVVISAGRLNASESEAVYCDPTFVVEMDESLTIRCSIIGEISYVYWFHGTDTSGIPFIRQDPDIGGEGYGEYNMTHDGALVINSANFHHEGVYTTVVYIKGVQYQATTGVEVTNNNAVYCDSTYEVELNESLTIRCSISGEHGSIYWFQRTNTSGDPFIWLEDDIGGEGYGEYNMTDNGSLIINSASLRHEGVYTIVVDFAGGSSTGTRTTEVQVTIAPDPPCPILNIPCNTTCPSCSAEVSGDGEVICSIIRSRPKMAIGWNITSQSGTSFTIHEPEYEYDADSGTWSTTQKLDYFQDAVGLAIIQCVSPEKDHWNISGTAVEIHYDAEPIPSPEGRTCLIEIIVSVVSTFVVTTVVAYCIFRWSRRRSKNANAI